MGALSHLRICDFTGQLAGAGATRFLAAFGAEVIRIEDPVTQGKWDILRGSPPFKDERRGIELGAAFQNHNVNKRGITLNLRTERGRELLAELVRVSNAVTENFAAGVMERLGFGYERLRELRPDVVYVSNSGFGHAGPYRPFKSWGPIAQAVCGLTHTSGLPDREPAGWGYSYMDHGGAYTMAIALLAALVHQRRTGEGQWVDLACIEAGIAMTGPAVLDATVNGRTLREPGAVHSNRSHDRAMAPHGIYPCAADDSWVAIACRDDRDWAALAAMVGEPWADAPSRGTLAGRLAAEDEIDADLAAWTASRDRDDVVRLVRGCGVPAAPVLRPPERCDDPALAEWGLWPTITHTKHGDLRTDGLPVHLSDTDWRLRRGGPTLGEHTERVLTEVLGLDAAEIGRLADAGVI